MRHEEEQKRKWRTMCRGHKITLLDTIHTLMGPEINYKMLIDIEDLKLAFLFRRLPLHLSRCEKSYPSFFYKTGSRIWTMTVLYLQYGHSV